MNGDDVDGIFPRVLPKITNACQEIVAGDTAKD
jgi:hypothetical protein